MRVGPLGFLSLAYNLVRQQVDWDKQNEVIPGVFLGVLPAKSTFLDFVVKAKHDIDDIKAAVRVNSDKKLRELKLVISVVAKDELEKNGYYGVEVVTPEDWKKAGVTHFLLPMDDFTAVVDVARAKEAIALMKQCYDQDGAIYVHCKAGRARSAMLCLVFLCVYCIDPKTTQHYTPESALELLKARRKQVDVCEKKMALAKMIIESINRIEEPQFAARCA